MTKITKPDEIGNRIRSLRTSLGMTQEELGRKIGYSESSISRIENGYGSQNLEVLSSLASALDTTLDKLIKEERDVNEDKTKIADEQKIEWYDAVCELMQMGFSLDRNSARDLIGAANELIRIRHEEKMS